MGLFLQLLANGLVQGAMVACLASGFGLVARSFRVFHIDAVYGLESERGFRAAFEKEGGKIVAKILALNGQD